MGAHAETFHGLAGLGDLITTCVSPEGRNRTVGERIGKGQKLDDILGDDGQRRRGRARRRGPCTSSPAGIDVEMPITEAVHAVLFEGKDVAPRPDRPDDPRPQAEAQ